MWTIPYMILEALDIDHKEGSSKSFKMIFAGGILIGMFSPLVAKVTGLSVVEMITLFPAYNGVFGLPITAALLFWAVNDKKLMGISTNSWKLNTVNFTLVVFSGYIAINSVRGVLSAIFGGMLS
jgi:Mn2+/Fe2+ NRAMP family transporter